MRVKARRYLYHRKTPSHEDIVSERERAGEGARASRREREREMEGGEARSYRHNNYPINLLLATKGPLWGYPVDVRGRFSQQLARIAHVS